MAEKRYFWLRLQRDFFKRHDIQIVENMPNGKDYILFYLKLLCESVDHEGNLRFSDTIPYNAEMLSVLTNTNVDIVRSAIKTLTALNMMKILDDETIYMTAIEKMTGSESEWAAKKREFRDRKRLEASEDIVLEMSSECPQTVLALSLDCPTEKEKEKELESELESEPEQEKEKDPKSEKKKKSPAASLEELLSRYSWPEELKEAVRSWITFKKEQHNFTYKPTSLKAFLKQVDRAMLEFGSPAAEDSIENAIANGYQGAGLDRIKAKPVPKANNDYVERLKDL